MYLHGVLAGRVYKSQREEVKVKQTVETQELSAEEKSHR